VIRADLTDTADDAQVYDVVVFQHAFQLTLFDADVISDRESC
jgi:hypothetical protein